MASSICACANFYLFFFFSFKGEKGEPGISGNFSAKVS